MASGRLRDTRNPSQDFPVDKGGGYSTVVNHRCSFSRVFLRLDPWPLRINKTARSKTPSVFVFRGPNKGKMMSHFMKSAWAAFCSCI